MSLTIRKLVEEAWETTQDKGFHTGRSPLEKMALIITEIAEAIEEVRAGRPNIWIGEDSKPEGVLVELADAVIRIADYFGSEKIDMDLILRMKLDYNKTRSFKHGGKLY